MKAQNQHGFTIIELSLFLGISALLLVGLLSGITTSINRQRFTDSVQSTQAFLQQQFSETINVVNNRSDSGVSYNCDTAGTPARGASSCIVIGKALYFESGTDQVVAYPIVSKDSDDPICSTPENESDEWAHINCLGPEIIDNINTEKYSVPWAAQTTSINKVSGISISHSDTLDSGEVTGGTKGDDTMNYIILLRSPYSGRTFVYGYEGNQGDIGDGSDKLKDETLRNNDPSTTNVSDFLICLHSQDIGNAYAGIYFTGAGSQDSVVTRFKFPHDECVSQES